MRMDAHARAFFNNTKNRSEIVHPRIAPVRKHAMQDQLGVIVSAANASKQTDAFTKSRNISRAACGSPPRLTQVLRQAIRSRGRASRQPTAP
jgi:hypothetical protein